MKRAVFVSLGTVAGVAAALNYTPVAGTTSASSLKGVPGLGGFSSGDNSNKVTGGAGPGTQASGPTGNPTATPTGSAPTPSATGSATPTAGTTTPSPTPGTTKKTGHGLASPTPSPTPSPTASTSTKPTPTQKPTQTSKPTPKPTTKPTPKPTPKPTHTPSPTPKPSPSAATGDFTGAAARASVYGAVQVVIRVKNGVITDIAIPQFPNSDPKSTGLSGTVIPTLRQEALTAQSAKIATVSGATCTSDAFIQSLQSALTAAGL